MELEKLFKICKAESSHDNGLSIEETYIKGYLPWFERYRKGDASLDKNLQGMTQYGLSENEAFFILAYTGGSSKWLNNDKRNGNDFSSNCKREFAKQLDEALKKMPEYRSLKLFRMELYVGYSEAQNILNWFDGHVSQKFIIPYYLSSSKENFNNSEIVWEINTHPISSKAKDIFNLTNNHTECEVLFERDAKFKILSVDRENKIVHLAEIASNEEVNFELTGLYHKNIE